MTTVQRLLQKSLPTGIAHMKNAAGVESLVDAFVNDGPAKFQVVSNFDLTLTCSNEDGIQTPSLAHDMVHQHARRFNYTPNALPTTQGQSDVTSWWRQPLDVFPSAGITKHHLEGMVWEARVHPRAGLAEMFRRLEMVKVPVTIYSSGISDIIEIFMRQRIGHSPTNLTVIANKMVFEENHNGKGQVIGYQGAMVDPKNKGSVNIETKMDPEHLRSLRRRHNVLLLGCSTDDVGIYEHFVPSDAHVLKVGFLGSGYEQLLPKYLDLYDVVLTEDTNMGISLDIVDEVVTGPSSANWA